MRAQATKEKSSAFREFTDMSDRVTVNDNRIASSHLDVTSK